MLNLFKKSSLEPVTCLVPYRDLQIYETGNVSFCCLSWQPHFIGNINNQDLISIIENEKAKKIKESVAHGNFSYCKKDVCPSLVVYKKTGNVKFPLSIDSKSIEIKKNITLILNYDKSCNLACPSCRNDLIFFGKKDLPAKLEQTHLAVIRNIELLIKNKFEITLNITGSGDPFASVLYRELILRFQNSDSIKFVFQTNGLLMNDEVLTPTLKEKTTWINVSIDAASEKTYSLIRKRGSWNLLLKNVHCLDLNISLGHFVNLNSWQVNFIVQQENFREMPDFLKWASSLKTSPLIWFNLIADWGHLKRGAFQKKAIWHPSHSDHQEFISICRKMPRESSNINYGNLAHFIYDNISDLKM